MILFTWIRHQHSRLDLEVICRWPKKYSMRNETMIFKDSDILEIWHRYKFEEGGVGIFKWGPKLTCSSRREQIWPSFFLSSVPKTQRSTFCLKSENGKIKMLIFLTFCCWIGTPFNFFGLIWFYVVKKSLQSTNWTIKVPPLHHQSSWITECPWLGLRLCSKLFLIWDSWPGRQRDENPGLK